MKSNYTDCLIRLLKDEGGYTNDPSDNGGPTNFGITLKDFRLYINKAGTASDVKNMTVDQAKAIFKSKYWDALDCDKLSSGVDYTCFDYGVNSGLGRPKKALDAFKSLSGTKLIQAINNERTGFLKALAVKKPQNQKFLHGWLDRVARVNAHSFELARKDNVSGPVAGAVAGGVVASASFSSIFAQHPYLTVGLGLGLAVGIGLIIHYFMNKGK